MFHDIRRNKAAVLSVCVQFSDNFPFLILFLNSCCQTPLDLQKFQKVFGILLTYITLTAVQQQELWSMVIPNPVFLALLLLFEVDGISASLVLFDSRKKPPLF